ncbi:pyridoxamine 5'-phosphate oxidase family protein, partial [Mesomycoplasma ovipneumoniae]|uniref:pyridoxamine 5'-phosphate oxidase family protein n=1 Tax=Mesomycoplasma ovipneumoniae TaxID=29562 RepID=UPI0030804E9A
AVLSTLGNNNEVHASVVHYITDKDENFYILTKTETTKSLNINRNTYEALTIHNSGSLRSLLVKGPAIEEKDQNSVSSIYEQIKSPKEYAEGKKLPPITMLEKGSFVVYKILPSSSLLQDFSTSDG